MAQDDKIADVLVPIALRSKKWVECTDAEKIEKLRMEGQDMQYMTQRVSALESLIYQLQNHTHDGQGKLTVPLNNYPGGFTGGAVSGAHRTNPLA